jgi:hypothetical protein
LGGVLDFGEFAGEAAALSATIYEESKALKIKSRALPTVNASAVRWLLYAVIGVCVVIGMFTWAFYSTGKSDHRHDKWAELLILTTIVFGGYLWKLGWHYRGRVSFWRLYGIIFLAHCALFVPVFSHGWLPIPILAVLGGAEGIVMAALIAWVMGEEM